MLEPDWICAIKQSDLPSSKVTGDDRDTAEEPGNAESSHNPLDSQNVMKSDSHQNDLNVGYNSANSSCFDPYGFKLSPENSIHALTDPDEAELSPEDADLIFDGEPSSSPPFEQNFDPYGFDITACKIVRDSDPYGFKLSPDEEHQVVLDLCGDDDLEAMGPSTCENREELENFNYAKQEVLNLHAYENREVLEECDYSFQKVLNYRSTGNQEVLESSSSFNEDLGTYEIKNLTDFSSHENQEVVNTCPSITKEDLPEPFSYHNQEILETNNHSSMELQSFSYPENQEVLDLDSHENQELLDFCDKEKQGTLLSSCQHDKEPQDPNLTENQELLELHSHVNQETLGMHSIENVAEVKRNPGIVETELNLSVSNNSSDSDLESNNTERLELGTINASTINIATSDTLNKTINKSAKQGPSISDSPNSQIYFGADLGSVFSAGGYIGCPDVADDLEPLNKSQENPPPKSEPEPIPPERPVRPPRPSLKVSKKS